MPDYALTKTPVSLLLKRFIILVLRFALSKLGKKAASSAVFPDWCNVLPKVVYLTGVVGSDP